MESPSSDDQVDLGRFIQNYVFNQVTPLADLQNIIKSNTDSTQNRKDPEVIVEKNEDLPSGNHGNHSQRGDEGSKSPGDTQNINHHEKKENVVKTETVSELDEDEKLSDTSQGGELAVTDDTASGTVPSTPRGYIGSNRRYAEQLAELKASSALYYSEQLWLKQHFAFWPGYTTPCSRVEEVLHWRFPDADTNQVVKRVFPMCERVSNSRPPAVHLYRSLTEIDKEGRPLPRRKRHRSGRLDRDLDLEHVEELTDDIEVNHVFHSSNSSGADVAVPMMLRKETASQRARLTQISDQLCVKRSFAGASHKGVILPKSSIPEVEVKLEPIDFVGNTEVLARPKLQSRSSIYGPLIESVYSVTSLETKAGHLCSSSSNKIHLGAAQSLSEELRALVPDDKKSQPKTQQSASCASCGSKDKVLKNAEEEMSKQTVLHATTCASCAQKDMIIKSQQEELKLLQHLWPVHIHGNQKNPLVKNLKQENERLLESTRQKEIEIGTLREVLLQRNDDCKKYAAHVQEREIQLNTLYLEFTQLTNNFLAVTQRLQGLLASKILPKFSVND